MNVIFQGFSIGSNFWLSEWSHDTDAGDKKGLYLGVYAVLGLGQGIITYFLKLCTLNANYFFFSSFTILVCFQNDMHAILGLVYQCIIGFTLNLETKPMCLKFYSFFIVIL